MTPPANGNRAKFRRLAVLIAVNFVDMIGFMIVLPLLPFYALRLHATPETVGMRLLGMVPEMTSMLLSRATRAALKARRDLSAFLR